MINKTSSLDIAHWILGDQFPIDDGPYHAIFCNWTLHFIQDKISYLKSMYQGLMPGGFMILSDKTCNSGIDLKLYHNFKRSQGVSEDEITNKAASVKDIMFINEPNWYLEQLKLIGFDQVSIINAAPCFTTFLAIKKPT
jgi:tRNA (cmo5U34)-methyltransferase